MRMRRVLFGLSTALLIALLATPVCAEGFLSVYEDLPLAPGLTEVDGSTLTFDSPTGRIVDAYAKGAVTAPAILKFYGAALPQLGWRRESDTRFRRETEVLHLDAAAEGRAVVVHFTISPE
jgi:hypothetical protein